MTTSETKIEKVESVFGKALGADYCIGMPGAEGGAAVCGAPWETLGLETAYATFSQWGVRANREFGGDARCCPQCRYNVALLAELNNLGDRWTGAVYRRQSGAGPPGPAPRIGGDARRRNLSGAGRGKRRTAMADEWTIPGEDAVDRDIARLRELEEMLEQRGYEWGVAHGLVEDLARGSASVALLVLDLLEVPFSERTGYWWVLYGLRQYVDEELDDVCRECREQES